MTTTHRMTTTAALILTLAGVAAPAATARPVDDQRRLSAGRPPVSTAVRTRR
jgi:hypothetical protein